LIKGRGKLYSRTISRGERVWKRFQKEEGPREKEKRYLLGEDVNNIS